MKKRLKFSLMLALWITLFPPSWLAAVSAAVIMHEAAHLAACRLIGIRILEIKALPWGLTAATPIMYEPSAQFVISFSGPMCNFFLLFFCPFIKMHFSAEAANLFALANLADGLLNLLPALPLDGGIILKAFLCSRFGLVRGFSQMLRITAFIGASVMVFGLYIFLTTGSNASYLVAGVFILYNLKHEKQLSICIRKRILTGEIVSKPRRRKIYADSASNAICLVDRISPSHTIEIHITNGRKTMGIISQDRLIQYVLENSMITLGECIEKT